MVCWMCCEVLLWIVWAAPIPAGQPHADLLGQTICGAHHPGPPQPCRWPLHQDRAHYLWTDCQEGEREYLLKGSFFCLLGCVWVVLFFFGGGGGGAWSFVWTRKFPGIVWLVGGTDVCGFASTVLCTCLFKTWWAFQSDLAVSTIWVDRSGCTSMPKMWPAEMLFLWTWWKFRTRLKSVQKVCFRVRCAHKWQKRQGWTSYLF